MPPNKEQRERLGEWLEIADNPDDAVAHRIERGGCQSVGHGGNHANIEIVGIVGTHIHVSRKHLPKYVG